MTPLETILKRRIITSGPVDVAEFMDLALAHPEHGYYMTRDPLGVQGDFTTAPEISQIFGELLGAWVADIWIKVAKPEQITLVECGPGRGTLMSDALRATRNIPGFHDALTVFMMETSPVLIEKQKAALREYDIQWIGSLEYESLAECDGPIVFLANEFLDALPIRQLVYHKDHWRERVVGLDDSDSLVFKTAPYPMKRPVPVEGQEADIFEFSLVREEFVRRICRLLKSHGGAALFIDYGHAKASAGDTLQAVKDHNFVPVLSHIGEADLTAHVDFSALADIAGQEAVTCDKPVEQSLFLSSLGIQFRAEALMKNATQENRKAILDGVNRLMAADQMGRLFKAFSLYNFSL